MKLTYIYFTALSAAIAYLFLSAFNMNKQNLPEEGNKQVIKFSHSLHKDMVDCKTCHSAVIASTSLKDRLFPNHDNCADCHAVDDENECKTCHYEDKYEPLIQKESELYFDHKFHIEDKGLECESCHKGISEVDYSMAAAQPKPIMEDCYGCHNNITVASNACESCHISTAHLIPQTHKSVSFMQTHKFDARTFDANCVMCHDNVSNSCEECHEATNVITEMNTPDDFYQPYVPLQFNDGSRKQQITKVHEFNYRFTHGIDSKGKTSECQSCHEVETFCASCHQSEGGDFAMGGIVPASHLKSGFFTIGVGSGGGEHAILAKRDIERCASCHDVQGADPTCINCHLDSDGIKGTNPKTHASNFMRDNFGDWHNSLGSICFNCHTSQSPTSLAGMGFCGYCHTADVH
jgi:hypothetical protein